MTPSSMVADEPVADASVANVVADATLVAYPVVCVIALSAVIFSPSLKTVDELSEPVL
mgnify:FL=1